MNGFSLTEVDWGAQDSSFFLYLVQIDHDVKPKDFNTEGLWGGLMQRKCSTTLMESLKDSLDSESTVRLTTRITTLCPPPPPPGNSIEVKCKTHTQQSTSSSEIA